MADEAEDPAANVPDANQPPPTATPDPVVVEFSWQPTKPLRLSPEPPFWITGQSPWRWRNGETFEVAPTLRHQDFDSFVGSNALLTPRPCGVRPRDASATGLVRVATG